MGQAVLRTVQCVARTAARPLIQVWESGVKRWIRGFVVTLPAPFQRGLTLQLWSTAAWRERSCRPRLRRRRVSYLCLRGVSEVRHRGGNRWLPKGVSVSMSMAGLGTQ